MFVSYWTVKSDVDVMLDSFQHRISVHLCDPEINSGRREDNKPDFILH